MRIVVIKKLLRRKIFLVVISVNLCVFPSAGLSATEKSDDPLVTIKVDTRGGVNLSSTDGRYSFQMGGRVEIDAVVIDDDKTDFNSGLETRRTRLSFKGVIERDWLYNLGLGFEEDKVDLKNAFLHYKPLALTIGNFKTPFSLEELTSSRYSTFMELSLPNILVPDRRIGIGYQPKLDNMSFAVALYGQAAAAGDEGDEGLGAALRFTLAPVSKATTIMHLGAGVAHEAPEDDINSDVRFRARPESHLNDDRIVDTGDISDVDHINRYNLEAAMVMGEFSLQAEVFKVELQRDNNLPDPSFEGAYVYASWFITGESRNYNAARGTFGPIRPNKQQGAWELALRHSSLDLNDAGITGGEIENLTLGINWYANRFIRFMANYIQVNTDSYAGNDDPKIFQIRAQAYF